MCTSPFIAYRYGFDASSGKWKFKLKHRIDFSLSDYYSLYGSDNVFLIPCGQCSACRLDHRKQWAVRCACESKEHDRNCFITLTYDNEHLHDIAQCKKDIKKFIKDIRNDGYKIRYFGCCERGSKTFRLHHHIILFGFLPDDLIFDSISDSGETIYQSSYITSVWKHGRAVVQLFAPAVAGYVAGYVDKKLDSSDGFQYQSTRPGIGYNYLLNHIDEIIKYDKLFGDFGFSHISKIPRYFEKILEKNGYSFYLDILKEERLKKASYSRYAKARLHNVDHVEKVIFYDRHFYDKKIEKLERGL